MTAEQNNTSAAVSEEVRVTLLDSGVRAGVTVYAQIRLLEALNNLGNAWQRAVLQARLADEDVLLEKLSKQWDDYEALIRPSLTAHPAKLFK